MLKLDMTLDGKITSANKIYMRGRNGGVYLAPEVAQYRKDVKKPVEDAYKESKTKYEGGPLNVMVYAHTRFFNKDGTIKRLDIDNFAKSVIDAVFPPLKIDDKAIFTLTLRKVHYEGQPFVRVKITELANPNKKESKANKKVNP